MGDVCKSRFNKLHSTHCLLFEYDAPSLLVKPWLQMSTIAQNWGCGQFVVFCARSPRAAFMIVPTFWVGTLNNLYFCYLQNKFHGHVRGKLWPGHESKSEVVRYSQPVPGRSEWDAPAAPLSQPWSSHTAGSPAPSPLWLVAHKLSWERRE